VALTALGERHAPERRRGGDAGVRDQDVDAAEALLRRALQVRDRSRIRDVAGHRQRGVPGELELRRHALDLARAARRDDHAGAGVRQGARRGLADPASPAGDDGHAAAEVDLHRGRIRRAP
jgi:hypothetical protein